MTHLEIVKKLIGDIRPQGASHIDGERFENLKVMCDLVASLVAEINDVAYANKGRQEHSIKQAADYASDFITNTLGIK